MAYRISSNGTVDNGPFYLYGYSFAINSAKTVQSITLPSNTRRRRARHRLVPPGSTQPVAATPTFSPAPGHLHGYAIGDALRIRPSGAVIYYTTNGTTPTTSSSQYVSGTPLSISAIDDDRGDGGGERLHEQHRGSRHLHDLG